MIRFMSIVFAIWFLTTSLYAQEKSEEEILQEKITELVKQLGDSEWKTREAAQTELIRLGKTVLKAVWEERNSSDFDIRLRVARIVKNLNLPTPDEIVKLDDYINQFHELKLDAMKEDAKIAKKYTSMIFELRKIDNSLHYLIDKIIEEKDTKKQEKIAQLICGVEYNDPLYRVNKNISIVEDALISLARDQIISTSLRIKAVRAFGMLKSVLSVSSLVDIIENNNCQAPEEILSALKKIIPLGKAPERNSSEEVTVKDIDFWKDWWSKNKDKEEYVESVKDLEIRKEAEAEKAKLPPPFLGVAKDENKPEGGGAIVLNVLAETGAEAAGLQAGDCIVEVNGWNINDWDDLVHIIRRSQVGQTMEIVAKRGEAKVKLQAVLGIYKQQ
ncbi:MAG: PDZ domain-containing protein [Planctomycetota bacterium]